MSASDAFKGLPPVRRVDAAEFDGMFFKSESSAQQARMRAFARRLVEEFTYQGEFDFKSLLEHLVSEPEERALFVAAFVWESAP